MSKMLGIAIIYFRKNSRKVTSTFLNLVELQACIADVIVDALKQELSNRKLDIVRLVAIRTENASLMEGINNGVYPRLNTKIPHL